MTRTSIHYHVPNMGTRRCSLSECPNVCRRDRLSTPIPPVVKVSPLSSAPSTHSPFADNFSQCANLSLKMLFSEWTRGVALRSISHTTPRKFSVFRNLASRFLKTNDLRQNPAPNALKIGNLD